MSDLNESLPIYVRIVEGVKDAILSGDLKEDEKILSTTYFSKTYNINIATVNKAINILVDEGLLYKKRGIGMFVKNGAVAQLIKERRLVFKERYIKDIADRYKNKIPQFVYELLYNYKIEIDD